MNDSTHSYFFHDIIVANIPTKSNVFIIYLIVYIFYINHEESVISYLFYRTLVFPGSLYAKENWEKSIFFFSKFSIHIL